MEADSRESLISRLVRFFKNIVSFFKSKEQLVEEIETKEEIIADQEEELLELKQENIDLENRIQSYKKHVDAKEFIEQLGSVDSIIKKVEEYDKHELIIKDLERENRELEEENKKLKVK